MNHPTFFEQERKIHEAYIRDEIKPMVADFCFCGTISPDGGNWCVSYIGEERSNHFYTYGEYKKMEYALLNAIYNPKGKIEYEDALFKGMVAALEVLKQIHISKGEVIDNPIPFKKRQLATT